MQEVTLRSPALLDDTASAGKVVHVVLIATKPDIIKQLPLHRELKRRGHNVLLVHTGQHYDENLSGGMLKEFGVEPDANLNVRGAMHEVVSQIIGRLGWFIGELATRGCTVIPYVHGDTTTAMAGSNAGFCHGFASVHVEAGIRTLTPDFDAYGWKQKAATLDPADWHRWLQDRTHWKRGSLEPYPEQFNTRASEAATGLHLAPVELDREFLLDEGYPADRIAVVGNSVVDATADALSRLDQSHVFERHPLLAKGDFVRFCIHRRENCLSERRFRAIVASMLALIEEGRTVLLISMNQTERAFERFGMKAEIEALTKSHPNFLYSPVWPQYVDVVAAMTKASVCATDSGSMQEEMNALGIPCVTLRFGSDRSESILAGGNLIAPPTDSAAIASLIRFAWDNPALRAAPKLYGERVSERCVDAVEAVLAAGPVFRTEEGRLNL